MTGFVGLGGGGVDKDPLVKLVTWITIWIQECFKGFFTNVR